ncbi:MAG: hypothetical protein BJ554DRAFT_6145, partial [Olpidium bornovanus]
MSEQTLYDVLNVQPDATDAQLKASHAYEVLSNPEKRRLYDQFGEAGLNGGAGGMNGFGVPEDFFDLFEGGAFFGVRETVAFHPSFRLPQLELLISSTLQPAGGAPITLKFSLMSVQDINRAETNMYQLRRVGVAVVIPQSARVPLAVTTGMRIFMFFSGRNSKGGKGKLKECGFCNGRGIKLTIRQVGPGMIQQVQT